VQGGVGALQPPLDRAAQLLGTATFGRFQGLGDGLLGELGWVVLGGVDDGVGGALGDHTGGHGVEDVGEQGLDAGGPLDVVQAILLAREDRLLSLTSETRCAATTYGYES
jgi:hypothetical protein